MPAAWAIARRKASSARGSSSRRPGPDDSGAGGGSSSERLPLLVEAADLRRRDPQGADDVLELAALVEHAEGLGGDVAGGVQVANAAGGGGADHVGGVVAPDAGGVALRAQLAAQAHVVHGGDADAELARDLRAREPVGWRASRF